MISKIAIALGNRRLKRPRPVIDESPAPGLPPYLRIDCRDRMRQPHLGLPVP
jgi:hypothetical protein